MNLFTIANTSEEKISENEEKFIQSVEYDKLNERNDYNETPLFVASRNCNEIVFKLLLHREIEILCERNTPFKNSNDILFKQFNKDGENALSVWGKTYEYNKISNIKCIKCNKESKILSNENRNEYNPCYFINSTSFRLKCVNCVSDNDDTKEINNANIFLDCGHISYCNECFIKLKKMIN
jgi:hypothetical protein